MYQAHRLSFFSQVGAMVALLIPALGFALANLHLGDVDDDGIITVRDIALVVEHLKGTTPLDAPHAVLADVTKDGAVNQADVDELIKEVLETRTPENLPLSTVRFTSPAAGEGDVSVNRETIVYFTVPLAISATLDTTQFYAEFAGRKVLSRVEISSDRKKASLFYLEPLPANSRVKVTFDGSSLTDLIGRGFDADGDAAAGGLYRMNFDTQTNSAIPATGITGRVLLAAPEGSATVPAGFAERGVVGVTITVDGQEQTMRTTTDAQGYFTLSPCPTGVFFVHIDGRTSTSPLSQYPSGRYFPNVGKKWEAIAGKADNPSGNSEDSQRGIVYLPCVCPDTLQPVSQTQSTTLGFPQQVLDDNPQLAGTSFTFPANTVFSDDGTRGGSLGPAPVPPDRLPSPLPPGLRLPFVFSLQSSGPTNFERPVAVCLPNLPDPLTGYKPVPGEKCALVAFNHDTGQWEVVGPMTVTADGNFMKTDAGVGLKQPGWGGGTPGGVAPGVNADGNASAPCDEVGLIDQLQRNQANAVAAAGQSVKTATEGVYGRGLRLFDEDLSKGAGRAKKVGKLLDAVDTLRNGGGTSPNYSTTDMARDQTEVLGYLGKSSGNEIIKDTASGLKDGFAIADIFDSLFGQASAIEQSKQGWDNFNCCMQFNRPCAEVYGGGPPASPIGPAMDPAYNAMKSAAQDLSKQLRSQTPTWAGISNAITAYQPSIIEAANNPIRSYESDKINDTAALLRSLKPVFDELVKVGGESNSIRRTSDIFAQIGDWFSVGTVIVGNTRSQNPRSRKPVKKLHCLIESYGLEDRFVAVEGGRINRILTGRRQYLLSAYDPVNRWIGSTFFVTNNSGGNVKMPELLLSFDFDDDSDGDGLSNSAEHIIGTSLTNADTDGDGISDGAELKNGSDPLSGLAVSTGVIARAPLTGSCIDIAAGRDVLAVACGTDGVYILGVRQGLTPTRLAQINVMPNSANVVAISSNLLAIGLGATGTMIVDISVPDSPLFLRLIKLGSTVRSLAAAEGVVHIGFEDGRVAQVDMITGRLIGSVNLGAVPHDLAVGKDVLYAVAPGSVKTLPITTTGYGVVVSTGFSGAVPNTTNRHRLFKGSNRLYAAHRSGFGAYDTSSPGAPALIQDNSTAALGWGHIVATGSNLAVACLGANNPDDVSLYDLGANGAQANFLTTFSTPGAASAVTIYNGLAYIADGTAGVQVINFRAFDTHQQPPTVTLALETPSTTAEEGGFLPVTATATDDVQVRNVEFLVDGVRVDTDGNFPFEARVLTPRLAPGKTSFTVQARASDTGGNAALSNILTLDLTADTQSPSVLAFTPGNDALLSNTSGFTVRFTEPVASSSLHASSVYLWSAGTDGFVGTDDDVRVPVSLLPATDGSGTYRDTASFQAATPLPPDRYRVLLALGITDAKGNPLVAPYSSTFQIISGTDTDGDGIADNVESTLGLNPENQDSNGNGIPDGSEDFDNDGLRNAWELRYGFDPRLKDTNVNGVNDNLEDTDKDTLNSLAEQNAGSDPFKADTDGDGWPDGVEVEFASNAADARSKPLSLFIGAPAVTASILPSGPVTASSPLNVTLLGQGMIIATPTVNITKMGGVGNGAVFIASPPATIRIGNPAP